MSPTDGGAPLVSAVIVAAGRGDVLEESVRSVLEQDHRPLELVVFGNGTQPESDRFPSVPGVSLRVGGASTNLGVAGGRNAALSLARGDAVLFLDDDATLAPGAISRAVELLEGAPEVGAVALRVIDPATGAPALWYHPYDPEVWSSRSFQASSVIGCGNLVRRRCLDELEGFWPGYFRELEEIDLSWRLIDQGWAIRYEPGATVFHPERTLRHLRYSVASNLLMLWRLLPPALAARQSAVKLPLFAARAMRHGELRAFATGLRDAALGLRGALRDRPTLSPATVRYLRRVHAPQGLGKRLQWSLRPLAPPDPQRGQPVAAGRGGSEGCV